MKIAAVALLGLLALVPTAAAQGITAPELKAAFLANFPKFTKWPDGAPARGQLFTFCVVEDRGMAAILQGILAAPGEPSKPDFSVRVIKLDGSLRDCQVLYVGRLGGKQSAQLFDLVKTLPVFTVGDDDRFAESGGVGQFIQANGRMRFAINVAAARRAHLVISSQLLSLAILVKDLNDGSR